MHVSQTELEQLLKPWETLWQVERKEGVVTETA